MISNPFLVNAHLDDSHKVVEGKLIHRPCKSRIRIWSPIDRTDRRAIVITDHPHNHPVPPHEKLTREGRDKYVKASEMLGPAGLTAGKVDRGKVIELE